jgi:hypothetical protein
MKALWWSFGGLLFLVGGLLWYKSFMLERNVDFLFTRVLGNGNIDKAFQNGDPVLQASYSREAFRAFAEENPHLFRRANVTAKEVVWRKRGNELFVILKAQVESEGRTFDVDYYCRPTEQQQWRLLGIVPGLNAAIPRNVELAEH